MCSAQSAWSHRPGRLPHSGILGLTFALNYPRLIAEFYALHRLLVPRHPPCALCSLTHLSTLLNAVGGRVAASGLGSRWIVYACPALVTLNHFLRYLAFKVRVAAHGRASGDTHQAALLTHGDDQIRTGDPLLAKQVLSQLSYIPKEGSLHLRSSSFGRQRRLWHQRRLIRMGLCGIEPQTSRLSAARSNHLS